MPRTGLEPARINTRTWNVRVYQFRHLGILRTGLYLLIPIFQKRAENETRTRDPNLGKVVLYQLSYFRKTNISPNALNSRGDRIRTCDHLVPNQARYRAALHPAAIFVDCSISDLRVQRYCILFIPPNFTTLFFILSLWIKTAFSTILVVLRKLYKYKNFIFYSCFGFILVFLLFLYGIVVPKAQKIFCYGEPIKQGRIKL